MIALIILMDRQQTWKLQNYEALEPVTQPVHLPGILHPYHHQAQADTLQPQQEQVAEASMPGQRHCPAVGTPPVARWEPQELGTEL